MHCPAVWPTDLPDLPCVHDLLQLQALRGGNMRVTTYPEGPIITTGNPPTSEDY